MFQVGIEQFKATDFPRVKQAAQLGGGFEYQALRAGIEITGGGTQSFPLDSTPSADAGVWLCGSRHLQCRENRGRQACPPRSSFLAEVVLDGYTIGARHTVGTNEVDITAAEGAGVIVVVGDIP